MTSGGEAYPRQRENAPAALASPARRATRELPRCPRFGVAVIVRGVMTTTTTQPPTRTDGTALVDVDPWLEPYTDQLRRRYAYYHGVRRRFDATGGLLGDVSKG